MLKRIWTHKKDLFHQMTKRDILGIPEIVAFNLMMALVPMLIVFVQAVAFFFSVDTHAFETLIQPFLPAELYQFISDFLTTAKLNFSGNPLLLIVTIATFALTVSKGVNGIFRSFLITYEDCEDNINGFKFRLRSIQAFFLLLGFAAVYIFLMLQFEGFVHQYFPKLEKWLVYLLLIVACFVFFYLLFKLAPNKNKAFRDIISGVVIATVGFILSTLIFTFYVNKLANFHVVYGSLSVIIILLMWLYIIGWVINFGIQINFVIQEKPCESNKK